MAYDRDFLARIIATGGINIPGAGAGLVAVTDAAGNVTWQAGAPTSGTAGGGLTGSYPNPQVQAISDAWQPGVTAERFGDLVVGSTTQVTVKKGVFYVLDPSSILTRCEQVADTVLGAIPAASASNFRLDQLVVDYTGAVSRLEGTQGTTVTLDNRTGAASIPAGSMLLWDLLVSSSGVTLANAWDRRTWAAPGATAVTTTLPVPITGRECFYLADATNGVVWHLKARRNNPDGSRNTSAYRWEYQGGPPLIAEIDTDQSMTSATYVDLATAGPSVTVPLAGDYDVQASANIYTGTAGQGYFSFAIGATAPLDVDAAGVAGPTAANFNLSSPVSRRRKTAIAASAVIKMQYRTTTAGSTINYRWRRLAVWPVRVG